MSVAPRHTNEKVFNPAGIPFISLSKPIRPPHIEDRNIFSSELISNSDSSQDIKYSTILSIYLLKIAENKSNSLRHNFMAM